MAAILVDTWEASPTTNETSLIIPDGCLDVILTQNKGERPYWHVSPLFERTKAITSASGTLLKGFRLQPGATIDEAHLLSSLAGKSDECTDDLDILDKLNNFAYREDSTAEAIECFASGVARVSDAAKQLGVSPRTLQRFILKATGQTPSYWLKLARVRKAARDLYTTTPSVELTDQHGYSDQAHLCRDIQYWFTLSRSELTRSTAILGQLEDTTYC